MSISSNVPWHDYGTMLREIAVGNSVLIEIGLLFPGKKLTNCYFSWLQATGRIRLKTTAEIMATAA